MCVIKVQQTITGYILQGRDYKGIVNNVLLYKGLTKLKS
jgi:hypothetical protein